MAAGETALGAKMTRTPGKLGMLGFAVVLLIGVTYAGFHLLSDLSVEHGAQPGNGLGAHAARIDGFGRLSVLGVSQDVLGRSLRVAEYVRGFSA